MLLLHYKIPAALYTQAEDPKVSVPMLNSIMPVTQLQSRRSATTHPFVLGKAFHPLGAVAQMSESGGDTTQLQQESDCQ